MLGTDCSVTSKNKLRQKRRPITDMFTVLKGGNTKLRTEAHV